LYKTALVPQAEARFNASEAGYRTGKVDFLDLLESERFLLNARVMTVMAEGNVGMQLARLERAVGTDLKPSIDSGENSK
jgi:cobalt-zinc-cadmium efflux system outer membrane protein